MAGRNDDGHRGTFGKWRGHLIGLFLITGTVLCPRGALRAQTPLTVPDKPSAESPPTLTVTGHGHSSSRPDHAVLRLGAVAQAEQAAVAQEQVNAVTQAAIEAIGEVIKEKQTISTIGVSLHPVYTDRHGRPMEQHAPAEPRISAYRAGNTLRVVIDDLNKVGEVIDAGVKAGANRVEGLSFELRDDTATRRAALTDAVKQASAEAAALAAALGVGIEGVLAINEGEVSVLRPRMEFARANVAALGTATPVQPGNVDVDASVTITYRISPVKDTRR